MRDKIVELRHRTGAGIMDCKEALTKTGGNIEKAIEALRKKGLSVAQKKASRSAKEGRIEAYVHHGAKIGVLLEVNCETDFVAKTDDFKHLTKDIAMQIAAAHPQYLCREDVPETFIEKEKKILAEKHKGKPKNILEKILEGELGNTYKVLCLLDQPFIKDPSKTIGDLMNEAVAKIGEKIVIKRFTRYQLGE